MSSLAGSVRGRRAWSLTDTYDFISTFLAGGASKRPCLYTNRSITSSRCLYTNQVISNAFYCQNKNGSVGFPRHRGAAIPRPCESYTQTRHFHDYFVTHLPSSSLHPDAGGNSGPHHKLPRSESTPHTAGTGRSPAAAPHTGSSSRELTVVRIPLRSAKHHYGAANSRGSRPYNEDTYQAGTIEIPAFAKRAPVSLNRSSKETATSAESASGDPQVFYFGVFDGHGGGECSDFLKKELHVYIEEAAADFELGSTLKKTDSKPAENKDDSALPPVNKSKALELEASLVNQWKDTVGGYFRRFRPDHFSLPPDSRAQPRDAPPPRKSDAPIDIEAVLMYAFLRADLDFVSAQAAKPDADSGHSADKPLNDDEILGSPSIHPHGHRIGGPTRFKGGSTASIALISTPTTTPFWAPSSPSTIVVAHVGDTRILLCSTATGQAIATTTNHHPSNPVEGARLRRYAATFVTDSFGEERMSGLANTRAFGDMKSKRIGVSAEPELTRLQVAPAQFSFMVLVSDGVTGSVSDQEIVDVVKEAKTPEQAAKDVVSFATEVSRDGDNASCLVVRLGGWERRNEGGVGSLGTKEGRDWRREEATDPRRRRT